MPTYFLRMAREFDFDDVSKHLLVVGELTGDCFSCREVGIDYTREKYCPQCRTDFRYITFRRPHVNGAQIGKLCQRRPDLTYIEYSDVKEIADRQKIKNFFK